MCGLVSVMHLLVVLCQRQAQEFQYSDEHWLCVCAGENWQCEQSSLCECVDDYWGGEIEPCDALWNSNAAHESPAKDSGIIVAELSDDSLLLGYYSPQDGWDSFFGSAPLHYIAVCCSMNY